MEIFEPVFNQMVTMFLLMALGFLLRKTKIIPENTGSILSKLMVYLFLPANLLNNQLIFCNLQSLSDNTDSVLVGAVLFIAALIMAYPASYLFIPRITGDETEDYTRSIYKYAIAMGNIGFAGNYIVQNVWGEEAFFKYTLFTFIPTIISLSWGLYVLIPKSKGDSLLTTLRKGLITPPLIALLIGMLGGMLGLRQYLPSFLTVALDNLARCYGPTGMLIAGIIIGGYSLKDMFGNYKVYIVVFLRLLLIPAVMVGVLFLLSKTGLYTAGHDAFKFTLLAFCVPCGMNTLVFPATYGGNTKTGSGMVLISNVLAIITIPLMFMLLSSIL